MKVGNYEVPDNRLIPNAIADAKKIYDVVKTGQIRTGEIGKVFGYKDYATGIFYRRLNSMISYGLLEKIGSKSYHVTDLGMNLCYPDPAKEQVLKNKAILSVSLWNELLEKCGKVPPNNNFWIQLKNIAKAEPNEAQKIENQIKKWYMKDISIVTLDSLGHPILENVENISNNTQDQHLSQSSSQGKQESRTDVETISFDKYEVTLPKGDLLKEWEKLKKYMDIKLEDYKYEEPVAEEELTPITEEPQEE